MEQTRILIVDDEARIREMIKEYLSLEGYELYEAGDGMEGLNLFREKEFSLVVLDVMMPKLDGWSLCREIRKTSQVPILMLTARGEEYDKLLAFELGVDDYVVKPFSPKELLARMKAILRRSASSRAASIPSPKAVFDGLEIDFNARNVFVDGEQITLTPKEFELLRFFAQNPNHAFSREQLLTEVWGFDFMGDDRTVDTHVKMLRESIRQYRKFIVTVWGTGYKFEGGSKK